MKRVLIAGATGYLGKFVAQEFKKQGYFTRVIVRNIEKFKRENIEVDEVVKAEVTRPETLTVCCSDIDIVFSSIGITRQKDGLTYMDVDYQANLNLLESAKRHGVKKFIYVSVLNGNKMMNLEICKAKERFVEALKNSGLDYCIVRPSGYFSDMGDFFKMAQKGRVFLFGNGKCKMNPIGGEDLSKVCVSMAESSNTEICVGGPEIFTYNQIAELAFSVCGKKPKITHLPAWVTAFVLWIMRKATSSKIYGPVEFLITVLSHDMVTEKFGDHHLRNYFINLQSENF